MMFSRQPRQLVVIATALALALYFWVFDPSHIYQSLVESRPSEDGADAITKLQDFDPIACFGPRGKLLNESTDDQLRPQALVRPYVQPLGGSYELLALEKSWLTADGRYGPYGLTDNENTTDSSRSRVQWDNVDWAALQDACLERNEFRFWNTKKIKAHSTLSLRSRLQWLKLASTTSPSRSPQHSAGRTAIVMRSYSDYEYKMEDLINIRSMIVEAALGSGASYAVFLLVDMKDRFPDFFGSSAKYKTALDSTLPPELRSIAVLWNEKLLRDWYPLVGEYSASMQMPQALQLFAQTYDGYDHYWQWEMDARLTGNALNYLESLSKFARASPRKQAFERASFRYMPLIHGPYSALLAAVNTSVQGRGSFLPVSILEVAKPLGPLPPNPSSLADNFTWGIGHDADFLATVPCKPLPQTTSWPYKDYVSPLSLGGVTPRIFCPHASARISWTLLNAAHSAQVQHGVRLASEAILPSLALWHGLKLAQPPQPWFVAPPHDGLVALDAILNGGPPRAEDAGFALGPSATDGHVLDDFNRRTNQNWWWRSDLPAEVMAAWLKGEGLEEVPYPLLLEGGRVYAPNMALHPFKTNH